MKKILTIILLFIGFTSYGQLVTNKGITIDSVSGVANNWVTQYQRKKTSDSLQANINTNTTNVALKLNKTDSVSGVANNYVTQYQRKKTSDSIMASMVQYNFTSLANGDMLKYNSGTSQWNNFVFGSSQLTTVGIRVNGLIDNWNSDMVVGAQDNAITRGVNTAKIFRMGMPTYIHNGSSISSQLFMGINNATDNIVYMGGGSGAYHAATQINFHTAAALATVTGTLAMRINSAQNILMNSGTDDGTAAKLQVAGNVSIVGGALTDQKTVLKITSTMPTGTATLGNYTQNIQTTSVSNTQNQIAFNADILAGATDAKIYVGTRGGSTVAGTGTTLFGLVGNYGVLGASTATTVGYNVGAVGFASGGGISAGIVGRAITAKNASTNIGGAFTAQNTGTTPIQIGVYAGLNSSTDPTFVSAALLVDNSNQTSPIFMARDNGTSVFEIQDGGKIVLAATNTTAGTTGAQTINKASGTINIAAAGTSVVLTNSLITAASLVRAWVRTNDANKTYVYAAVPAAGSATIYVTPAPAAEVSVGWEVIN